MPPEASLSKMMIILSLISSFFFSPVLIIVYKRKGGIIEMFGIPCKYTINKSHLVKFDDFLQQIYVKNLAKMSCNIQY